MQKKKEDLTTDFSPEAIGKRITAVRLKCKMSQQELAERAGYTDKSSISKLEAGKYDISVSTVAHIAEALNVSCLELLGYTLTTKDTLHIRREEMNLSQQDLADAIGVNRSTISRYESGEIEKMPVQHLIGLAKILKTSLDDLLGLDAQPELLRAFNTADPTTQKIICKILDIEYKKTP